MPAVQLDQGNTYRCGAYAVRAWFEGYGYQVAATAAWAKYVALADSQQGLSFVQVHNFVLELAKESDADVIWLQDGFIKTFDVFDQAVRDSWCVVLGVWEADLNPGQNYYHYLAITGLNDGTFSIVDSFSKYDHEDGHAPVVDVHKAASDNWDDQNVAIAFQLATHARPISPPTAPSRDAQIVTILSVIGDKTYLNPPDLTGIQVLVQQAKAILGA